MSATPPQEPNAKRTLVTLPAEIRLRIYSFIIPTPTFPIDLCARRRSSDPATNIPGPQSRKSIAQLLVARTRDLTDLVTNQNGLQLLFVCRLLAAEVYPVLMATTVRFCCAKHFVEVVRAFQYGVGEGRRWMTRVEVLVDLKECWERVGRAPEVAATRAMMDCRRVVLEWYGRLDMMGKEKWTVELVKEDEGEDEDGDGEGGGGGGESSRGTTQQRQGGMVYLTPNGVMGQTAGLSNTAAAKAWVIKGCFDIDYGC